MASSRFPNKPMAIIQNKPMIQWVWEKAIDSNLGEVIVACSEKEVHTCIKDLGGNAILTNPDLPSGTDRIFEAIKNVNVDNYDSIINLQGDMPLIKAEDINKVNIPLTQGFDMGTLVTELSKDQIKDINVTKAKVKWIKKNDIGEAYDFYKLEKFTNHNVYHHVGIYSFRYETLRKFVLLPQSINEKTQKLEQLRAIDAKMTIGVSYVKNVPISVDTKEDLIKVNNLIKKYETN